MRKRNSTMKEIDELEQTFKNTLREELWVSVYDLNEDILDLKELEVPTRVAKLNILSQSIMSYDQVLFGKTHDDQETNPRMYFYNFIIYMDSTSNRENYQRLRNMKDNWYYAGFEKGSWGTEYKGEIERSGSPIIYQKHTIYISDRSLSDHDWQDINDKYDEEITSVSEDRLVIGRLNILLKDIHFSSANVFKVGNGNLIQIKGKNENTKCDYNAMYDVGYHYKEHPYDKRNRYGYAVRAFRRIKPDIVFLSHWDDDHIMGCVYAQKDVFDCPWIAPEITKNAIGAKRLAKYLSVKGKLILIKRDSNKDRKLTTVKSKNKDRKISFYLGQNKRKNGLTKENCGGLAIEIINETTNGRVESLFCGDVPYRAIETTVWNSRKVGYDNLIVPHHGSKMSYNPLKVKSSGKAIICCNANANNPQNNYRPVVAHVNALQGASGNQGYKVFLTEHASGHCIRIKLD